MDGNHGCHRCASGIGHSRLRLAKDLDAALPRVTLLSCRERDVLSLLPGGLSNHELSRALFITERTARAHVASIVQKLAVDSRLQACLVASAYYAQDCRERQ